jgi:hypothetical protein
MLMCLELAGGTNTGLNLIDNQKNIMLLGDSAEALEEEGRCVVFTALRLDGLDNGSNNGVVESRNNALKLGKASLLLSTVFRSELVERILELGERSGGPVEGRDIKLMDGLAMCSRQRTK